MKFKKIFLIGIALLSFYLAVNFLPYASDLVYYFKHKGEQPDIPVPVEAPRSYAVNIDYAPVPDNIRKMKIDCANSADIPAQHRQGKILCLNLYQTDASDLKNKLTGAAWDRIILYGGFSIIDYPTKTVASIDNYIEQIHTTARFIDNHLYPKFSLAAGIKIPAKKLYVHLTDGEANLKNYCLEDSSACARGENEIYLLIHEKSKELYVPSGLDKGMKLGYSAGKNEEVVFWYNEIQPPNCPMLSKLAHEVTHYFDNLAYGTTDIWLEEGVARIFELAIYKEICPPGVVPANVRKEEGGISYPVENLDFPSSDAMTFFLKKFWNGDECKLAQFLVINEELKNQGLSYHKKMSEAFKSKSATERISALINSSSDPKKSENIFLAGGCKF